jgi:hypothetical protein
MRLALALTAVMALSIGAAEAQSRNKQRQQILDVSPRSWLNPGTAVPVGRYQTYSSGLTPWRTGDSIVPTGSPSMRLLPGRFEGGRPITVDFVAPDALRR